MAGTTAIWRNRRTTELLLILAATPAVVLLFSMGVLNEGLSLSLNSLAVPIGLFAAFLTAHFATRALAPNADPVILPVTFLLSGIGITFVLRLKPSVATNQLVLLFVAVVLLVVTMALVRDFKTLTRYKYLVGLAGIILLLLPAFIGVEHYGSKIWLSIAGFSIQPGEFAKPLIIIFLACYLADNRELLTVGQGRLRLPNLATLLPLLVMWSIALAVMILENDFGSAMLIFGIFVIMLYAATGRKVYVFLALGLVAFAVMLLYFFVSHAWTRFEVWLNPFTYAQTSGYQLVQAIYSMADGGLFGTGLGRGYPTLIPVVESDFIFAAIAEEMGLLGAAAVIIGYFVFATRGFVTSARAKDDMASILGVGLTTSIALQAFVIIGGVTRVIPLTGLTLPFMSQGGSSLLASFIIVALLLRVGNEGVAPGSSAELQMHSAFSTNLLGRAALGHRLNVLTIGFGALFCVLIASLSYTMVIKADYYQTLPNNNHAIARMQKQQRGSILSSDGVVLATSVENPDGTYSRTYPQGSLAAHVVGYCSQQYGTSGVELSCSKDLTGTQNYATWTDAINALAGVPVQGNDVTLTLDTEVQETAEDQLSGSTGAIVVLDPETGAVLAEASSPTYDINDAEEVLSGSGGSSESSLYNRATQALYAPGSSFKTVTLLSALLNDTVTPSSTYSSPNSMNIGGADVTNFGDESWSSLTVEQATWYSANTVYGQIAAELGAAKLVATAESLGFNDDSVAQDFLLTMSLMPDPDEMTEWETAWAGIGQPVGEHESPAGPQATVMEMALVYSAIANDGVIMSPYVVSDVSAADGSTIKTTSAKEYATVCDTETAEEIRDILVGVVKRGTGTAAAVGGTTVAGKTGTAEAADGSENAWFVGMAPADDPKVVVAVCIEDGGQGGSTAAPMAAACIKSALKAKGVL